MDFEFVPGIRQQRGEAQPVAFEVYPQQGFEEQAVHPCGRSRVPGPTAAAGVRGHRIDIGRHDVGLNLIDRGLIGGGAMVDGIEEIEEFPGAAAVTHEGEGHGAPDRTVGVLTAVFAHSRNVTFDISRIECGFVKRRIKQLDQSGGAADQALIDDMHCLACTLWIAGPADDRPTLRQGIDLAFLVGMGAERFAVIEVGATIPVSIPCVLFEVVLQL